MMMATAAGAEQQQQQPEDAPSVSGPREVAEKAVAAAAGVAADAVVATAAVTAAVSDAAAGGAPPSLAASEFVSKEHRRAGPFKAVLLYLDYVRWLWNVTDKERLDREQPEGMVSERVKVGVGETTGQERGWGAGGTVHAARCSRAPDVVESPYLLLCRCRSELHRNVMFTPPPYERINSVDRIQVYECI